MDENLALTFENWWWTWGHQDVCSAESKIIISILSALKDKLFKLKKKKYNPLLLFRQWLQLCKSSSCFYCWSFLCLMDEQSGQGGEVTSCAKNSFSFNSIFKTTFSYFSLLHLQDFKLIYNRYYVSLYISLLWGISIA